MSAPEAGVRVSDETRTFLESQRNLVLGTLRRDGARQASPVWYLWTGDAFVISTISATAKWWNLKRDPRCSVCVDDPETGRMVVAYGAPPWMKMMCGNVPAIWSRSTTPVSRN